MNPIVNLHRRKVNRLWDIWTRAAERHAMEDTPASLRREEEAWDQLIDYIERNGLNYTELDPRPWEEPS